MIDRPVGGWLVSRPLLLLACVILLAHAAIVVLVGPGPLGSLASNLLQLAASATVALSCIRTARSSAGLARPFWTLTGLAFALWTGGQAFYTYHENWLGDSVPNPSWSHFLFRLHGAPLLMALLLGSEEDDQAEEGRRIDWLRTLDFVQVGILFLFFYFELYFVPGSGWHRLGDRAIFGFLEVSDLENWGLAGAFLLRARLSRHAQARELSGRLVSYLAVYAAGSSFSNYAYTFWRSRTGEWPDLVFTFSLTVASLSAATWRSNALPSSRGQGSGLMVNWTPAVLPLIILALALPMARNEPEVAFVAVFSSVACFGARLVLTQFRRERLLEALRASEARYATLLRLAPDAIFVHVGGRVTYANPATARLMGVSSPDELLGRDTIDFATPERREELRSKSRKPAPDATVRRLTVARADGTRVPIESVSMSFDVAPGTPGPAPRLVIARDVTDRERADAEREALIREMEGKNAELERFNYTVSHDLRTPLITIAGFLGHVEEAGARGDMAAMRIDLERIRAAAARMDRLLTDLLQLSRVGQVLGSRDFTPFEDICREAVDLAHGPLLARGVAVEIESGLPLVHGDRSRLLEVMQNLIDNAAKFMGDQRAPRVHIGARQDGGTTVLFVRDNGIGIDPQHHEQVFRLFDRLDPKVEGTGVGLAIVKRIVELHRGRIWIESEGRGLGTTVCFTLPPPQTGPGERGEGPTGPLG
jgi:two-component system, LuxR family, sensor kinase FixL